MKRRVKGQKRSKQREERCAFFDFGRDGCDADASYRDMDRHDAKRHYGGSLASGRRSSMW